MIKRFGFFILVNMLIIAMVTIVTKLIGLEPYMTSYGIDYGNLMVFCLIWGMAGSFISLWLSKWMAKKMFGVQLIAPDAMGAGGEIVRTVHRLAKGAGLSKMPEVGIYPSAEVNAFATGPSKNNSLVAVSEGLLQHMNHEELEGVLAHEVGHIANGDMVTMTLIQGVVNAFVMFLARVVAFAVSNLMRSDDEERGGGFVEFILVMVFQVVFGILGSMVTGWFSRHREFRADAMGARLAGRGKMVAALERLRSTTELVSPSHAEMASFKIAGIGKGSTLMELLSTHPPLDRRIEALKKNLT